MTISRLVCLGLAVTTSVLAEERSSPAASPIGVKVTQNTRVIPRYEVFELTFQHEAPLTPTLSPSDGERGKGRGYANPFFDVSIEVAFTAPNGENYRIGGFHYGSSAGTTIQRRTNDPAAHKKVEVSYRFAKQDLWKARFAPGQAGDWKYSWAFANTNGQKAAGQGAFTCVLGRKPLPGFVRQSKTNPFGWLFDDGTAYFPIGIQECLGDGLGVGTFLAAMSMEGSFRLDRKGRPEPPAGAIYKPGPANNPQNADVYFRNYARAGFNLFRLSQANCSYNLYRDLDNYLVQEGLMTDELILCARKYGFRIFYGLFGFAKVFNDHPENAEAMAKLKRFVQYSVNRWGAYVDFWEFLNEQKADAKWYEIMTPYLRSIDPYRHPITTSWERPELAGIEINAPHWYSGITGEDQVDRQTAANAANWKRFGKPVIVGEQGNSASKEQLQKPGIGGVWDIGSARRMRIRNWTALFNEIAFIFWNTSYAKDGHYMNIWLGPQERQYVRAMQDFAYRLDKEVRMTRVTVSDARAVRGYGLTSPTHAGVYLHHFSNHEQAATNISITIDVPLAAKGYWYAPENAAILKRIEVSAGQQTLAAPEFTVDLALLITRDGPPDSDHDGIANDLDADDDNDEVADACDAFPLDPEEWADKDADMIGDNMDADSDADGLGDDKNRNGILDHEEMDGDGDGVRTAQAVPWDAFPRDPKESRDTDGDGIGDNADTDKDGDGWSDAEEIKAGTDVLDKLSFPSEPQKL